MRRVTAKAEAMLAEEEDEKEEEWKNEVVEEAKGKGTGKSANFL